jgi:thiol-disulfide isomerase/thioredoxin
MLFPRLSIWYNELNSFLTRIDDHVHGVSKVSGFIGGFLFGIPLGIIWTPCAGPILAAIISLIATQPFNWTIVFLLLAYSIGAGIPLFLIAYFSHKIIVSFHFLSHHVLGLRRFFGALMIATSLALILDLDVALEREIAPYLPTMMFENNPFVKSELERLGGNRQDFWSVPGPFMQDTFSNYGRPPEITGIVNWINSPPLSLKQLKGKVVLLDFWTYSCINCLRTLPYLEKWYADYKDKGLVIIGIHTPEFEFEKNPKNVMGAAKRLGIHYPIAQDNDYKTWTAFHNNYWPARYLIDQNGNLRSYHFGEGAYVQTENDIRHLLGLPELKEKEKAQTALRPLSPEIYLGANRGFYYTPEILLKSNKTVYYDYQVPLSDDQVGLKGKWKLEEDSVTAHGVDSYLQINFIASHVYLVLSGKSQVPLEVSVDGIAYSQFVMDGDRKYDIAHVKYGRHVLSIKIPNEVSAYAFTFGDE